ncbi:hypothetical protein GBF38_019087 [Nibea albiflora]|uniref:Uncharacterized protein n=1 Tax=Nibea albiflora TaxID=240163 RepID=A0ACB7F0S3_NIBAL|nr:hypothetical protein GBF38_019087 [Nibea albiflora]
MPDSHREGVKLENNMKPAAVKLRRWLPSQQSSTEREGKVREERTQAKQPNNNQSNEALRAEVRYRKAALELVVQYFAGGHLRKLSVYNEAALQLKDSLLQHRRAHCSSITEE